MAKYIVTIEDVTIIDVNVETESPKEAKEIALDHMNDGSELIESPCAEIIDISLEEPT